MSMLTIIKEALNKSSAVGRRIFCPIRAVLKLENTPSIPPIQEPSAEPKSLAANTCRFVQSFLKSFLLSGIDGRNATQRNSSGNAEGGTGMNRNFTFMGNQFDEIADIIDNARTRAMRAVCTMTSVRQHLNGGKNTTDYYILCQIAKLVNEGVCADGGVFAASR